MPDVDLAQTLELPMAVDAGLRITDFAETPQDPPAMPGRPDVALASMGIYIFNAKYLFRELERDLANDQTRHDFGRDIIPRAVHDGVAGRMPSATVASALPARPTGATSAPSMPTGTPTSI